MNQQLRRPFIVILVMFTLLGLIATSSHFFQTPSLSADGRNGHTILRAVRTDRSPITANGTAIASSLKMEDSQRFQRSYANGSLYAPITGYFSPAFSQATGLETAAESVLDGQAQALLAQRLHNLFSGANRQGGGLVLAIDPAVQEAGATELGGREGAVAILDAKTGAVLALYSSSSYGPNTLATFDAAVVKEAHRALPENASDPLMNRTIGGNRYALGSASKIPTSVTPLGNGVTNPDTLLGSPVSTLLPSTETGVSSIESQTCGGGQPTLSEAFARSRNTNFVIASQGLTHEQPAGVATHFGFDSAESILLPVTPSVFPEQTDAAQLAMSSIDQFSVQVTPVQMARVVQAIANKGTLVRPYLTSQVVDASLVIRSQTSPVPTGQAVTSEITQSITEMMEGVVSALYDTGQSMAMGDIQAAAETGTAETRIDGKANAWAVGFAPADDPQIAFAVIVESGDTGPVPRDGGVTGPIARSLLEVGLR